MTYLPAKNPPWKNEGNPLGPPSDPSTATPIDAVSMANLETRVETGLEAVASAAVLRDGTGMPSSVVSVASASGPAAAKAPTVYLDSYYDAAIYANKSAAINTAVTAAQAVKGTLECQEGRVYSLDNATMSIAPSSPLTIKGNNATLQANWGKPRCIDFTRTADYQTFQDIKIEDLILDANSLTSSSNQSIVGNLIDGGPGQRVNFARIRFRRLRFINVSHTTPGGGGSLECLYLASGHLASNESTQTSIVDVVAEDCDCQGGNVGLAVLGTTAAGGSVTAGQGVNVFMDRLFATRINHDIAPVPSGGTAGNDAHVQFGGLGFGNTARVTDCTGTNSWDVAVEIDGFMDGKVVRGRFTDSFDGTVLFRNFRAPTNVLSQTCQAIGVTAENVNYDPGVGPSVGFSPHWQVGGDSSTAGYIFGFAEFIDCTSRYDNPFALFGATSDNSSVGHTVYANGVKYHGLKIRNLKVKAKSLAVANSDVQRFPSFVDIAASYSGAVIDIDGIHFELAGVRSGGANIQWHLVRIQGASVATTTRNVTVDMSGLTGLVTTNDTFYWVMYGQTVSTTAQGFLSDVVSLSTPGSNANQNPVFFGTLFSIPANAKSSFMVYRCALSTLNSNGSDYTIQSTHHGKILVRDIVSQRNSGGGGPFQGPSTYTPGASPDVFQNADVHAPFPIIAHVQGGTVSKIEYSEDNVTFYDVGSTAGRFYVNAGHYLRVTYSVAPALYLKFRLLG